MCVYIRYWTAIKHCLTAQQKAKHVQLSVKNTQKEFVPKTQLLPNGTSVLCQSDVCDNKVFSHHASCLSALWCETLTVSFNTLTMHFAITYFFFPV